MINRKFFFDQVRSTLFGGKLSTKQVSGLTAILDEWETPGFHTDDRHLAYMLGTAFHETAFTMQPIKEYGTKDYFFSMYDPKGSRPSVAKVLGNTQSGDGVRFCGRGYVQLTGRRNYTLMSTVTGKDLVGSPDLAMDPATASVIMYYGMYNGTFTGKKLTDYFSSSKEDWTGARRIINGTDRASQIADYAKKFYAAISYTT